MGKLFWYKVDIFAEDEKTTGRSGVRATIRATPEARMEVSGASVEQVLRLVGHLITKAEATGEFNNFSD